METLIYLVCFAAFLFVVCRLVRWASDKTLNGALAMLICYVCWFFWRIGQVFHRSSILVPHGHRRSLGDELCHVDMELAERWFWYCKASGWWLYMDTPYARAWQYKHGKRLHRPVSDYDSGQGECE